MKRQIGRTQVAKLLCNDNIQRTHSNVGSSLQPTDRCDSCDPQQFAPEKVSLANGTTLGVTNEVNDFEAQELKTGTPSPSTHTALEQPYTDADGFIEPSAKRRRHEHRAGIPPALHPSELQVQHRYSAPYREDTSDGHYVFDAGDNLTPRFKIMRKFGEGTFGQVLECWDRRRSTFVAVKVIRNMDKYREAAMVELQVLATLAKNDADRSRHIVQLIDWFDYRGHICMVFERLGPSVYDCLRKNAYKPIPLVMARLIVKQVLESVAFMHDLAIIHTDLKPENLLFVDDDFRFCAQPPGSNATFEDGYHSSIVSTRHYRAPEIVLGVGWSLPCDIWSLGCILIELLTGDALFQTHENLEHLAMMEAVLGPLPKTLVQRAVHAGPLKNLFQKDKLIWPQGAESTKSIKAVAKMKQLTQYLLVHSDSSLHPHIPTIVDLLKSMMAFEPSCRCTAREALQHPFFRLAL